MKKTGPGAAVAAGLRAGATMRDALVEIVAQTPDERPIEADWKGKEGEFAIVAAVYRLGQIARKGLRAKP